MSRQEENTDRWIFSEDDLDSDQVEYVYALGKREDGPAKGKQVLLIRHGESAANIGFRTGNHEEIPLTERGLAQAQAIVREFALAPDLIASSPYRRAIQTAEPIRANFPEARWEVWDELHEFVYLSPFRFNGTTRDERRPYRQAYWRAMDPDAVDGEGAESFRHLLDRVRKVFDRIRACPERRIVLITHEQFIKAAFEVCAGGGEDAARSMRRFASLPHIGNCETIELLF